jgi:hypothetical protein
MHVLELQYQPAGQSRYVALVAHRHASVFEPDMLQVVRGTL